MSKSELVEIDQMLKEAWGSVKTPPDCVVLSLDLLRATIDESLGRTLTNEEFAAELSALDKAGRITFVYPDVVELRA